MCIRDRAHADYLPPIPARPVPQALRTYDEGGDVALTPEQLATVKAHELQTQANMVVPGKDVYKRQPVAPQNAVIPGYDTGGDVSIDGALPTYDKGGPVDVNDGQHQLAILKHGEKVLNPKEADAYRAGQQAAVQMAPPAAAGAPADFPGRVMANPDNVQPVADTDIQPEVDPIDPSAQMSTQNAPLETCLLYTSRCV